MTRWFLVNYPTILPVNIALADATDDYEVNAERVREKFNKGFGITRPAHEIEVTHLPADFQPTAADLDRDAEITQVK